MLDQPLIERIPPPRVTAESLQACLLIIYGEELGRRFTMDREQVLIGRSAKCDVHLDQDSVSRNHCRIQRVDGRYVLSDLGSTNGTYVNDELVDETALREGDQIKIGRSILKFMLGNNVEAQYHEEIYRMMTTDGLTQVYNRRYFDEMLDREVSRARRYERPFCVLVFDIDHFKRVNDTYGHLAGDAVLRQIGSTAKGRVRRNDVLARIGGEEFGLITPEIHLQGALELGTKINKMIVAQPFEFDGDRIDITISVGVAEWLEQYETGEDVLRAADEKLYQAKELGRNRVCG